MSALANQVALITGAGSGLGRQLALTLAIDGASIAAIDLNPASLPHLAADLPKTTPFAAAAGDVTDRASLRAAVAAVTEQLGPPDLVIANAGIGRATAADDFPAADFEAQVRVNLIGVANTFDAVLPLLLERKRGHLVAISSLASYHGLPKMAGYCASKAGVNALMDSLRYELRPHGIACTTVCPGWIRTPLTADLPVPQPYMLGVDDAARRIVAAIRRRRPFVAFPQPSVTLVRLARFLPTRLSDALIGFLVRRTAAAQAAQAKGTASA
jgi:NAD(P)-dependent dehydrogenase (short-subunit alcohol dehydrogenase family)